MSYLTRNIFLTTLIFFLPSNNSLSVLAGSHTVLVILIFIVSSRCESDLVDFIFVHQFIHDTR